MCRKLKTADVAGVGNYNISDVIAADRNEWTIEAEDYYAITGGAVKRQKDPSGPDPNLFEVANVTTGSSLSYPRIYSRNQKMQLYLLYSNGGEVTGDVTVVVGGKPAGTCKLPSTGGWGTYKNATCLGAKTPF